MNHLSDGYGDPTSLEDPLERWEPFLVHYSHRVCSDLSRVEDVAQEGRVALWVALQDGAPYPVEIAKSRMKQVSWYPHKTPPTGSVHEGNRYEPRSVISVQAQSEGEGSAEDVVARLFGMIEHLGEVEIAYHRGEIAEAISSLTPKQRAYVYARFWCGIEGNTDASILAKQMNPQINDRNGSVWSGRMNRHGKRTPGVKERLAESLEHLRGLVTADG